MKLQRKAVRKQGLRLAFLASNIAILIVVASFMFLNAHTGSAINQAALASAVAPITAANPLDQVSSANIALTVARLDSLPEATAVNNQADTQAADIARASTSDSVASKPQVVTTSLKSRANIQTYITQSGDTVPAIAAKFGVTSESIRWSNTLNSDNIAPNQKLVIPPVNGIVYIVKAGDTADSLAQKFSANKDQITAYNDAEINGLQPGEQIIVPNGTQATPAVIYAGSLAPSGRSDQTPQTGAASAFPWGGVGPIYGSNGYDFGYCTWYVASRISVPSNWGNASSWSYYAPLSGWTVSSTPRVGAIAQTPYAAGGEGHVAIVEAISPDGTQMQYSDMNGLAGFDRIGHSGWVPAGKFPHYIYH